MKRNRKRVTLAATWACVLAALGLASSCREPTSIEIEARTTLPPSVTKGAAFLVGSNPVSVEDLTTSAYWAATTDHVDSSGLVGTLVTVPEGGRDEGRVSILVVIGATRRATTCKAPLFEGCIVARRLVAYRANTRLRLPIVLEEACVNVPCDALTTCAKGSCVSSSISCDDDALCGAPGGPPIDASIPETGGDAPPGDAADASDTGSIEGGSDGGADAPSGSGNDCPTTGGGVDCNTTANVCCEGSGLFNCRAAGACQLPARTFFCTGRKACTIPGHFCCASNDPVNDPSASCNTACTRFLCNSSADCPAFKPSCTGRYYPSAGPKYLSECMP